MPLIYTPSSEMRYSLGVLVFSIITPVFNGEDFIEETIVLTLKAIETSGFSFEYIVIDDGSTDSTRRIIDKFGSKVIYLFQENAGQADAINNALAKCKGKYSIIVNSDDPINSSMLFVDAKEILDHNPSVVGTYPDWNVIDQNGKVLETVFVKDFSIDEFVGNFNCLIGPGGVFRTRAALNVGGWKTSYRFVPDYDFWLRLLEYGTFHHISNVQASWRKHESSISISSRGFAMSLERVRVIREYLDRNSELPTKFKNKAIANSCFRAAVLSFFDKKIQGRKLILRSIRLHPRIVIEKDPLIILFLLTLPVSGFFARTLTRFLPLNKIESQLRRRIS